MAEIVLSDIFIYPVKSLTGIRVSRWPVTPTGLLYDRQWMLVDHEGQFLSQRRLPKMALITTSLWENMLIVSAVGMIDLILELDPAPEKPIRCTIWQDQVDVMPTAKIVDDWFSKFLGCPCRLVYLPEKTRRQVNLDFAMPGDITALTDGFPFLLLSEDSLTALNAQMGETLTMNRFRPNLVVSGCGPFAEDFWRYIEIGEISFRLPKPCSRCSVTTVNPITAETGKEPLATLNRLRKWENKVYFGQNAIHEDIGMLYVGDRLSILQTGTAQPPIQDHQFDDLPLP